MVMKGQCLLLLLASASLGACTPVDVPSSAVRSWSFKDGFWWRWQTQVENGCVSWLATEERVSAKVLVGLPCQKMSAQEHVEGKGFSYSSVSDELMFNGYWPWTKEISNELEVYDERGMFVERLPCPYTLNQDQINEMRLVVNEAARQVETGGTQTVLARITVRIDQIDGYKLSSSAYGCTDKPSAGKDGVGDRKIDPWPSNRPGH
jgi:hypothetical protein